MLADFSAFENSHVSHGGFMTKSTLIKITASAVVMFALQGCNMFGAMENPSNEKDTVAEALVAMDEGRCSDAVKMFDGMTSMSDDGWHTLGWARLCAAGAPLSKIAKSAFSYSSSSSNSLTLIGTMANSLIPQDSSSTTGYATAISAFNNIKDVTTKNPDLILANLVKIASIIAKQAPNDGSSGTVVRLDISPAACNALADCNGAVAACSATMSDADANALSASITAAASLLSNVGNLGSLGSLIGTLNSLGLSSTDLIRCNVVKNFLSQ